MQAVFICLLMPFLSKLWGIPFDQLSSYLKDGAACFLNIGTVTHGMFLLSISYFSINVFLKPILLFCALVFVLGVGEAFFPKSVIIHSADYAFNCLNGENMTCA